MDGSLSGIAPDTPLVVALVDTVRLDWSLPLELDFSCFIILARDLVVAWPPTPKIWSLLRRGGASAIVWVASVDTRTDACTIFATTSLKRDQFPVARVARSPVSSRVRSVFFFFGGVCMCGSS